jgi:hypothetical protein
MSELSCIAFMKIFSPQSEEKAGEPKEWRASFDK